MNAAQLQELRTAWPGTWTESPTEPGVYLLDAPPRGWTVYAYVNPQGKFVVGSDRLTDALVGGGTKAADAIKHLREKVELRAAPMDRLRAALPRPMGDMLRDSEPTIEIPGPMEKAKFRHRDSDTLPEPMDPHARAYYLERARMFPGRSGE